MSLARRPARAAPPAAPRRPPPGLDRRSRDRDGGAEPAPVELLDAVSGPFERQVDAIPRGHRRR